MSLDSDSDSDSETLMQSSETIKPKHSVEGLVEKPQASSSSSSVQTKPINTETAEPVSSSKAPISGQSTPTREEQRDAKQKSFLDRV